MPLLFKDIPIKLFLALLLFVFTPIFTAGQLRPKLPETKGPVKKIIEKTYGKRVYRFRKYKYRANSFSGWKSTYYFDDKGNLLEIKNFFKRRLRSTKQFEVDTLQDTLIYREISPDVFEKEKVFISEDICILDDKGRTDQVLHRSGYRGSTSLRLGSIDFDIKRDTLNQLVSFRSKGLSMKRDSIGSSLLTFQYDSLQRLIRVDRKDVGYKTIMKARKPPAKTFYLKNLPIDTPQTSKMTLYTYDQSGNVETVLFHYPNINYGNPDRKNYEVYRYEYDDYGNWIKRFILTKDDKWHLQATRKITYLKG